MTAVLTGALTQPLASAVAPAPSPFVIGHRGAPAKFPEHSAAGYREALAAGAACVEPDVVPTRDGVLVVRHDWNLADTTDIAGHEEFAGRAREGDWWLNDFDWAELQSLRCVERLPELRPGSARHDGEEPLLRLRDLVALINDAGQGGLVVEIKRDGRALAEGIDFVAALAREFDGLWRSPALAGLRIESFEVDVLRRLASAGVPAKRVVLVETEANRAPEEEGPARLTCQGLDELASFADGVSVRDTLLNIPTPGRGAVPTAVAEACHARDLELLTYTMRRERRFLPPGFAQRADGAEAYLRAIAATGIDGVFVDDPRWACAVLGK